MLTSCKFFDIQGGSKLGHWSMDENYISCTETLQRTAKF